MLKGQLPFEPGSYTAKGGEIIDGFFQRTDDETLSRRINFRKLPDGETQQLVATEIRELKFDASNEVFRQLKFRYQNGDGEDQSFTRLARVLVDGKASLLFLKLPDNTRLRQFADPVDYLFYLQKGEDFYKLEKIESVKNGKVRIDDRYKSVLAAALNDLPNFEKKIKSTPYNQEQLSYLIADYNKQMGADGEVLLYASQDARSSITYAVGALAQAFSLRSELSTYSFYGAGVYFKFKNGAKSSNRYWGPGVEVASLNYSQNNIPLSTRPGLPAPGTQDINGSGPLVKLLVSFGRDPISPKPVEILYGLRAGLAFVSFTEERIRNSTQSSGTSEFGATSGFLGAEFGVRVDRFQLLAQLDRLGYSRGEIQVIKNGFDLVITARVDLNKP